MRYLFIKFSLILILFTSCESIKTGVCLDHAKVGLKSYNSYINHFLINDKIIKAHSYTKVDSGKFIICINNTLDQNQVFVHKVISDESNYYLLWDYNKSLLKIPKKDFTLTLHKEYDILFY